MNVQTLNILTNCSGKTYNSLIQAHGQKIIDLLIDDGYIVKLANGSITRTEQGLQLSKPMQTATNEKFGKDDYQLLIDSGSYNEDDSLICS